MQELTLTRHHFGAATIGQLPLSDGTVLWTLEDKVQTPKVYGQTAIPFGRYKIEMTFSRRFGRTLPLLLDVPGFSGVRIHSGNTIHDTEGCILVGIARSLDTILQSRVAMGLLLSFLCHSNLTLKEETWITIE